MRESAGRLSYRELSRRAHYSATALSEAAGGCVFPSLAVTLAYVRACGADPATWEKRWQEAADELAAPESAEGRYRAPYLGLMTFEPDDAELFFGRDELLRDLVYRVSCTPFIGVFGASGSGKSSLLRAGLVPALRHWPIVVLTPGEHPVLELAIGLSSHAGISPEALRNDISSAPENIDVIVRGILHGRPDGDRVVFLVDQFEEVFTLCHDEREREAFIACLLAAGDQARVVLGMRADFYSHCAGHGGLVAALRDRQILVGPMEEEGLRAVVVEPAARAGLKVEASLVVAVLADARGQAGALPLLAHALLETWKRRTGQTLTLAGYRETGGIQGAIAQTAERVYAEFDAAGQRLVKDIFLRLTALGEGTEDTRRRLAPAELLTAPDPAASAAVLSRLTHARLVTADASSVQMAHEAVLRSWPRLRGWLAEDREFVLRRRRLTEAAAEWDGHGREEGALYRGARLAAWQGREMDRLNEQELAFLTASWAHRDKERRSAQRRMRRVVAGLVAAFTAISVAAGAAIFQARQAQDKHDLAASRRLAADARAQLELDPELALLLARQALRTAATREAEAVLRQAMVEHRQRLVVSLSPTNVRGVAYSPDGTRLATTGSDGVVRVWDTRTMRDPLVLAASSGDAQSPVFSPDGTRLATTDALFDVVRVWDLTRPGQARVLHPHLGRTWGMAFAADGRLATAGEDGAVSVWTADGRLTRILSHGRARKLAVAVNADGTLLAAVGDDDVIRVWGSSAKPRLLRARDYRLAHLALSADGTRLALSADGTRLASGDVDGTVWVWDPRGPGEPIALRGHDRTVRSVAFSADGRLASASSDGTVRVWDPHGRRDPLVLRGHHGTVWSVALSPDGSTLASAGEDNTLRLWDARPPGAPLLLRGHTGTVGQAAFTPDGQGVVSGGHDGTVRLWKADGSGRSVLLRNRGGEVLAVAVSPDGRHVADAGADGRIRIFPIAGGPERLLRGHEGPVSNVAFSPDGRRLASGGSDGTVRSWNTDGSGQPLIRHSMPGTIRYAAYSPDGRHVAGTDYDGSVTIWPLEQPEQPVVLRGHHDTVSAVAFSPDGHLVASASTDGAIHIQRADGTGPRRVLHGHQGLVWSLAFSPDGQWLASGGSDDTARFWQVSGGDESVVYHGFGTTVEGITFGPGGRLVTGHGDGIVRIWQCQVCRPIGQLLALADHRITRALTAEEKAKYLP
ncbi:WD40 repeat domain-containing protein [Nonomuraea sp. NEAU-A123]|uniref:WD40 repeat domain-containing protein n=1 Tax=Nonomuraea sp. NEAU-A123 TaxID=2839649 RepID=UPI001BE434E6|nr:WD40 repeat domain-containing protein [Nonomuraea sp. NEAU-A123]